MAENNIYDPNAQYSLMDMLKLQNPNIVNPSMSTATPQTSLIPGGVPQLPIGVNPSTPEIDRQKAEEVLRGQLLQRIQGYNPNDYLQKVQQAQEAAEPPAWAKGMMIAGEALRGAAGQPSGMGAWQSMVQQKKTAAIQPLKEQ